MIPSAEINVAFYDVLNNKRGMKQHFGQWTLIDFWAFHVNERLQLEKGKVKASKLLRAIEADLDKDLRVTDNDKQKHGIIQRIGFHTKRLKQRQKSALTRDKTKKRTFIFVETDRTRSLGFPDNPMLEGAYRKYAALVDSLNTEDDITWECGIVAASERLIVDVEAEQVEPVQPRPVTPTGCNNLDRDENADIRELLGGIINPDVLTREDLFVNTSSLGTLRQRIKDLGCQMKENEIRDHYNRFYDTTAEAERLAALDPIKNRLLILQQRFRIPLLLPAIQDILAAIVNIADEVPAVLELTKFGGSKGLNKKLITVVPSTTQGRLYYNLKTAIKQLVDASVDEASEIASYHIYTALAKIIANVDEQAFVDVSKYKERLTKRKMDPLTQKALIYDATLTSRQFALIRQYIIVTLGYNIFQAYSRVKELDVDFFQAIPVEFRDGPRKRLCHYRPIDKLFKWALDKKLGGQTEINLQNLSCCHILLGGDHGQGAFRMVATLLLFSKDGNGPFHLELEEDQLVGYIECKKETYSVLENTIGVHLNESLKACGEELVFLQTPSGELFVEWGAQNAARAVGTEAGTRVVGSAPLAMFMLGDLQYQLTCQGREGGSTWWCAFCQLGWDRWQTHGVVGKAWTAEDMELILIKAQEAEKNGKKLDAAERKKITRKPLFDAVPIQNYIVPVLHALDLFANRVKDTLDLFIDHRLEDRPIKILEARAFEADQKVAERKKFDCLQEAKIILEASEEVGDGQMIKDAKAEVEARTAEHKLASKHLGRAAAEARKVEKKKEHGALSQTIRQAMDELLATEFHILRSSYHGGDYEGNHCRKMMRQADAVMAAIEERLLEIPREKRAPGCDDTEVTKYCRAFKRMFQYMDVLSHFCYQPYGSITDSEMEDIKSLVDKMDKLFRKLSKNTPPKVHAWKHLVEQLDRFRGLKYHNESKN